VRAIDLALARTAQFGILRILSWGSILVRELKPGFRASCDCAQQNLGAKL
jgi:hypothetical protein